jgi:alpha-glucosidase
MPWVTDNHNGGFSDAKPWLPVAVEHLSRAVAEQAQADDSTMIFYKNMIRFRQSYRALIKGAMSDLTAGEGTVSFVRTEGDQRLFCAFNLTNTAQPVDLPEGRWRQDKGAPFTAVVGETGLTLPPYQAYFAAAE